MTDQTTWKGMEKAFHIAIKGHLNVRHQAYVMGKLREIVQVPFDAQVREIASLRSIISECATACGAAVSVECSEEFMAMLPDEIRTVMTGKTREIERLSLMVSQADHNYDCDRSDWQRELAALKAQSSGVVLPLMAALEYVVHDERVPNEVSQEVAAVLIEAQCLNSSPVSDGDPCMCGGNPHTTQCLYEHFLSYSGLADQPLLRYAYFHGAGFAAEIDQPSAGVMDERAAFEAWYETTYGISLEPEFRANHFIGYVNDKANHRWTAWQARAALSANHGEQVRECEDWSVFFGYLIDKYEGHEIAEERLQGWLSEMLADPHYGALFRREKVNGGQPSPIALAIEAAEEEHGGLRAAAKALGIDAGYLSRLKSGEKLNPGGDVLAALGLERVTMYRAAAPSAGSHKEQG